MPIQTSVGARRWAWTLDGSTTAITMDSNLPATTALAKLAGVQGSVRALLRRRVLGPGSMYLVTECRERYVAAAKELRAHTPDAFGDLPVRQFHIGEYSLPQARDILNTLDRDIDYALSVGMTLGLVARASLESSRDAADADARLPPGTSAVIQCK